MGSTDVLSKEFKGVKHLKNFIKLASKDGEPVFPFPFCHVKGTDTHKIEMTSPSGKLCFVGNSFSWSNSVYTHHFVSSPQLFSKTRINPPGGSLGRNTTSQKPRLWGPWAETC